MNSTATKKSVSFRMNATESEDYHQSISNELLDNSQKKVKDLEKEVSRLKNQLKQNNLDEVYKDNDLMKKELKNMSILMEEN